MNNIDDILDKYFEAETSIEEERILQQYFCGNKVDKRHEIYAPLFQYIDAEKNKITGQKRANSSKHTKLWISIASCAAIFIGILLFVYPHQANNTQSLVYIDGKKIEDITIISSEALNSLMDIEEERNDNIMESQIDLLDSFID